MGVAWEWHSPRRECHASRRNSRTLVCPMQNVADPSAELSVANSADKALSSVGLRPSTRSPSRLTYSIVCVWDVRKLPVSAYQCINQPAYHPASVSTSQRINQPTKHEFEGSMQ